MRHDRASAKGCSSSAAAQQDYAFHLHAWSSSRVAVAFPFLRGVPQNPSLSMEQTKWLFGQEIRERMIAALLTLFTGSPLTVAMNVSSSRETMPKTDEIMMRLLGRRVRGCKIGGLNEAL